MYVCINANDNCIIYACTEMLPLEVQLVNVRFAYK